jgi:hypothetical protein
VLAHALPVGELLRANRRNHVVSGRFFGALKLSVSMGGFASLS